MKKATNRILSFLTAFAMVIGVLVAPFTSANAAEGTETPTTEVTVPGEATTSTADDAETNKVTVHKILMSKDAMGKHDVKKEYQGGELNVTEFFEASAEDIGEVYFAWAKKDKDDNKYYWIKEDGNFTATKTEADEKNLDTIPDDTLGGETVEDKGKEFTTTGFSGEYKIFEIHNKSTYKGKDGQTLTDMKAVPVVLTLPLRNNQGTVLEAHVYPKNTEEKPKIDKNFQKDNNLTTKEDKNSNQKSGAVYENYDVDKSLVSQELDKNVPYEVKTEIPAKSKYAQAYWDDIMTKGLTYNKDLLVTIDGEPAELGKDYTLTRNEDNGFKAEFTESGLAKINNKAAAVTVVLTYSAKINKDAVIDIPESNNVRFFYGNNKGKGNTPVPTNPNDNGEISVKKTWDDGSAWAEGEEATFKLVDANTGKDVTVDDVDAVQGYEFKGTVTLSKDTLDNYTWKGLKKDKQYKVVEVSSTTLSDAEYRVTDTGAIEVTNHKSNNPQPLEPTTPKVETYGKKFVKVNEQDERLPGAEFKIKKKGTEEYLAEKSAESIQADQQAATAAKTALDDAVKAYNALTEEQQTESEKAKVTQAQEALNAAVIKANEFYVWGSKDDAKTFTSNDDGQFEVTRLDKGSYTLVETKAPTVGDTKYAKRDDIDFEVGPGTYSQGNIDYTAESNKNDATKVVNRKVSIPQTGGIGSLIFIVAGLAIMAVAFVAMKRRNAVEA